MTNKMAIWLGIIIIALVVTDAVMFDWEYGLYLARKFYHFLDWLAFWR